VQSWIIGKVVIGVVDETRISHVSHSVREKGCVKVVRCVERVAKASEGSGLEKACDPQETCVPQLPQRVGCSPGGIWVEDVPV
jgi:hypothetical protein